jgi:hypothetical protein
MPGACGVGMKVRCSAALSCVIICAPNLYCAGFRCAGCGQPAGCPGGQGDRCAFAVWAPSRSAALKGRRQQCVQHSTAQLWQDSPPHPHLRSLPADVVAVQWLLFEEGRLDVLRDAMSALTGQPGGRGAAGQLSCHAVSTGRWATGQPGGV